MTTTLVLLTLILTLTLTSTAVAHPRVTGYPTSRAALRWHAPAWFLKQAACIHRFEWRYSWHIHKVDYRGRPSPYSGGMQFLDDTWERAGGTGSAGHWSPWEQLYRAYRIWAMQDGRVGNGRGDWSEWGTAGKCGLR